MAHFVLIGPTWEPFGQLSSYTCLSKMCSAPRQEAFFWKMMKKSKKMHTDFQGREKKENWIGFVSSVFAQKLKLCFLLQRGAILLDGKRPAKSTRRAPDMHLGVNSGPHRERAKEQNYAPRLGQEAFSCKIMKIHRNGLVNGLLDRPSNKNASVLYKKGFARGALNHKCAQFTSENAIPEGPKCWQIRFAWLFRCRKN